MIVDDTLRKTILLVEDEALIAMTEATALRAKGYTVHHVRSGEQAIEAIIAENPLVDLVLMDINLGRGIDGTEAARQILDIRELPVVFLSSCTDAETVERAATITSYGYVVKNLGIVALDATIRVAFRLFDARLTRKQAEVAREELLERMALISAHLPGVIYQYRVRPDGTSHFPFASLGINRIYGVTPQEVEHDATPAFRALHPDDHQRVSESIKRSAEMLERWHAVYRVNLPPGTTIWVEGDASPQRLDDGSVLWHGFIQDITARKHAQDELGAERERLGGIIWGTDAGTWEWNVQTGQTVFNERWAQIVGHTLEEISPVSIGTWEHFTHPDDLKRSTEAVEQYLRGELPLYECECRMRHKDGHWVWVLDRGRVVPRTSDGQPLVMMGTHTDITVRKATEVSLHLLSAASVELQSCTPDSINYDRIADVARQLCGAAFAVINVRDSGAGTFSTAGVAGIPERIEKAVSLLGFRLVGRSWRHDHRRETALGDQRTTVFPSLSALTGRVLPTAVVRVIEHAAGLGEVAVAKVSVGTTDFGDLTVFFAHGHPMEHRDLLEAYAGMVGVALARLEVERRNTALVREKENLLREVQHRVKNNMNSMAGLLALQADAVHDPAAVAAIDDARGRLRTMAVLYEQLYSTDDHDSGSVHEYLHTLVNRAVSLFPNAARVKVEVRSECAGAGCGEPVSAGCHDVCSLAAAQLSAVGLIVNELVTNAMKYAFADSSVGSQLDALTAGMLLVTTRCREDAIRITVEDTGPGMPEPRDDQPASLGLTIVRALTDQLGGKVRFESGGRAGSRGTRVVVEFPPSNKTWTTDR